MVAPSPQFSSLPVIPVNLVLYVQGNARHTQCSSGDLQSPGQGLGPGSQRGIISLRVYWGPLWGVPIFTFFAFQRQIFTFFTFFKSSLSSLLSNLHFFTFQRQIFTFFAFYNHFSEANLHFLHILEANLHFLRFSEANLHFLHFFQIFTFFTFFKSSRRCSNLRFFTFFFFTHKGPQGHVTW